MPGVDNPGNWAEAEFGSIRFYDNRLKERLYSIAQDFYSKPCNYYSYRVLNYLLLLFLLNRLSKSSIYFVN
jgi:hypothetical protein